MTQGKRVYSVEYFTLLDDTVVEVKPLPIKRLRLAQDKINKAFKGVTLLDENGDPLLDEDGEEVVEASDDDLWEAFVDVVELVMKNQPACSKFLEPENGRDELEDTLDQDTLYEIVKVSTGYDFLAAKKRMETLMEQTGLTL